MCRISLESGKLFDVIQKFPEVREVPHFDVVKLWPSHRESPRRIEAGEVDGIGKRPFASGCRSERERVNCESVFGELIRFEFVHI